jgi:hypothetical protein
MAGRIGPMFLLAGAGFAVGLSDNIDEVVLILSYNASQKYRADCFVS